MRILIGCLLLALTGCIHKAEEPRISQPNLTQKAAIARFEQVSNVQYDQEFWLNAEEDSFRAVVKISFDWKRTQAPLYVDFFNGTITKTTLNGKELQLKYNGEQIVLDNKYQSDRRHELIVEYTHAFDRESHGLYRFVDPQDKKVYLYSNLEPNYANVIFPCFDQPDLKGTYTMRVHAPADWEVVTATAPTSKQPEEGGATLWTFPRSAKMSTYVWSLHAGPYQIFEDKKSTVPMRLLARQTIADQVRVEDWFGPAKASLKFFSDFFGVPYPYKKMDLVVVPDFSAGGMENIAAITLTESVLKNGVHTKEEKIRLASLIVHEIAHMWFGDLVTMKWWDDLWLNESFASLMEGIGLPATGYRSEAWRAFHDDKLWAYATDDRVTTHPIAGVVADTSQALTSFDGITYGKGAAVMKQLSYLLTEEKFRDGLKHYFIKHRDGNTTLTDFISSLGHAANKPLEKWTLEWLKTAGVNTVKTDVNCENGKIKSAKLRQSGSKDHPVLREQAIKIAFLEGESKLEVKSVYRAVFSGDTTELKELVGKKCPAVIFPNYQDYGYAKFEMDPRSLANLKSSISIIQDPFIRQIAWNMLWTSVQDGEWSIREFAQMWLQEVPREMDDKNLAQLMEIGYPRRHFKPSIFLYYSESKGFKEWRDRANAMMWEELAKAQAGSDRQKHLFDGLAIMAAGNSLQKMAALLDGKTEIAGLEVDQGRRWRMIRTLAINNYSDIGTRIDEELRRDSSSIGKQEAVAARAAIPIAKVKEDSLAAIASEESKLSFTERRVMMANLFPVQQTDLRNQFSERFFTDLEKFIRSNSKSDFFLTSYMAMAPIRPGKIVEAERFLMKHRGLPQTVNRALKEMIEFGERLEKVITRSEAKPVTSMEP